MSIKCTKFEKDCLCKIQPFGKDILFDGGKYIHVVKAPYYCTDHACMLFQEGVNNEA